MLFYAVFKGKSQGKPGTDIQHRQQVRKSVFLINVYVFNIHYKVLQRFLGINTPVLNKLPVASGFYPVPF